MLLHGGVFKFRETEKRTESINVRVTEAELAEVQWCIDQLEAEFGRLSPPDIARKALGEFVASLRAKAPEKGDHNPAAKPRRKK